MDVYEVPINHQPRYENVRFGRSSDSTNHQPAAVTLETPAVNCTATVADRDDKRNGLRKFTIVVASTLCLIFAALVTISILLAREINDGNDLRSKIHEMQTMLDANKDSLTYTTSQLNESGSLSRELNNLRSKRLLDAVTFKKSIDNLNISMLEKLQEVNSDAEKMNNSLDIMRQNIANFSSRTDNPCTIWDWQKNKCFVPVFTRTTYASAMRICEQRDGDLANIYSSEQMDMMMNYIRQNLMSGRSLLDFYLGMTIVPSTGSVMLSDGQQAPNLTWDDAYPSTSSSSTSLYLRVNTSPSSTDQYLWNVSPSNKQYFICEF